MNDPAHERHSSPPALSVGSRSAPPAAAAVGTLAMGPAPRDGAEAGARPWAVRLFMNMAAMDWVVVLYIVGILLALLFGSGPGRTLQIQRVLGDMLFLFTGLILSRGEILRRGSATSAIVYRAATMGVVVISYFQLQGILPAVTSRAVDAEIFSLDMRVFGFEPALTWDRFVSPLTTEWFAFFYFSYFLLLTVHVIPCLVFSKNWRINSRFAFGAYVVFCVSHLLYMVVPGFGPYAYLAEKFDHTLRGPMFWPLVVDTVVANGAQKDIFPSLHTGIPTYCTTFALLNRHRAPFKYVWPLMVFWTSQIVIATMFLRWHYLIDIVAGITVAVSANLLAERVEQWESAKRESLGLQPVLGPIWKRRAS